MTPRALIITTTGINCDRELAEAFELAGAESVSMHLNRLTADPSCIDQFDLIGLPGGFSYGDAVAAGRIAAQVMRSGIYDALLRALERGVPMIAPCNGFQIAVQVGLLPGPVDGAPLSADPPVPSVALADNDSARFIDRWVRIEVPAETRCIWTRNLQMPPGTAMLPIAHGEGRFIASEDDLSRLETMNCVAVRYAPDDNPNGSLGHVAGICDRRGLVFGLMPHPERYTRWTSHPTWTRLGADGMAVDPPGLQMFRNAVNHVREHATEIAACDAQ
jgi:phosphoribosylformylglycinamidine synthase I